MDIPDTKSRGQLKGYFVKNAIPTEGQFADLIEAGVNQHDDGLVKTKGEPLSIEAGGDDTSQKRVLSLFRSATDPDPACVVSLNPFGNPADANTRVTGLGIGDAGGHTRLFLDPATGRMGLGTVTPQATLHVTGGAIMPSVGNGPNAGIMFPTNPGGGGGDAAWLRYYPRTGEQTTFEIGTSNDANDHIALMASGNVGIGTRSPTAKLHAANSPIVLFENSSDCHLVIKSGRQNTGHSYIQLLDGTDDGFEIGYRAASDALYFNANKNSSWNNAQLVINANGRIGIGTSTPTHPFHIKTPNNNVGLFESTGPHAYLRLHSKDGINNRIELACRPAGRLALWVAGRGDALNITRDGKVGIWTASPRTTLEVNGDLAVNGKLDVPGGIVQEDWHSPSGNYNNSWMPYGSVYNVFGYFKDRFGIVHLRGLVKNGTIGRHIWTLPAGYRPAKEELHVVCTHNNASGRVDIRTNGQIVPLAGSPSWISLDGITFSAA